MLYINWRRAWRAVRMARGEQSLLPTFPLRSAALFAYEVRRG